MGPQFCGSFGPQGPLPLMVPKVEPGAAPHANTQIFVDTRRNHPSILLDRPAQFLFGLAMFFG